MTQHSLRLRLLLVSATSVVISVALAAGALAFIFSDHVERTLRADLEAQMIRLVALIDPAADPPAPVQDMPDPRFATPLGGLYWQITDPATGAQSRSRSLWDATLSYPGPLDADGVAPADAELIDPEGRDALAVVRHLGFELDDGGNRLLQVILAAGTAPLDAANARFQQDLLIGTAMLAIVLFVTGWVQVTLGLAPLSRIQLGVNAIRTSRAARLDEDFPREVMPLITEVNELLRTQDTSIAFARARASDLAHGLKSAITVLNAEAASLRRGGNAVAADSIEGLTAGMVETIDHQLRLARLRHRSRSDHYASPVLFAAGKVVETLRRTPQGEALRWAIDIAPSARADIDASDLLELLGILLENATKWARTYVACSAQVAAGRIAISIDDDGPGVADELLPSLGARGKRLDQNMAGTGIGLAIAREIVNLNRGSLQFGRSELGGFRATITLPVRDVGKGPPVAETAGFA